VESSAGSAPGSPWEIVPGAVEGFAGGTRVVRAVGAGLKSVAGSILQQLARVASVPVKDQRE
jgi:hypothetical protein